MHRRVVVIAAFAAAVLLISALVIWQKKVDELNRVTHSMAFVLGDKADAQCDSAKQNRRLWSEVLGVVGVSALTNTPQGLALRADVERYIAHNPSCQLRQP